MIALFPLLLAVIPHAQAADSCATISTTEGDLAPLSIFSTAPTSANVVYRLDTETPTGSDVTTKVQNGRSLNSTANCPADCVFQLITYYAIDITTNEPFDYLYIDPQYVAFVPYPFVRDDSVEPVTCAKVAGYCGATVPIYRYYKFTWKGISHAYSYASDHAIPGFVQEKDPICYIWPEAAPTTAGPAMNPTMNPSAPDSCGLPLSSAELVPLKVYDNLQWGPIRDHYYTTKLPNSTDLLGYVPMDLPLGMVSLTNSSKCGCLVELSQMLDNTTGTFPRIDHKLADLQTETNRIYEFYQPTGEKIYCVSEPRCGATIPIYKHYQYFDFDSILTNSPEYMMYSYLYPYVPLCYIWNTTLADTGATTNSTNLQISTNTLPMSNDTTPTTSTGPSTLPSNFNNTTAAISSVPAGNQTAVATNPAFSGPSAAPGAPTVVPPTAATGSSNPIVNVTVSIQTTGTSSATTGVTSSIIPNPTGQASLTPSNGQVSGVTGQPTTGSVPNATSLPSLVTTNDQVSLNTVATTGFQVNNASVNTVQPFIGTVTAVSGSITSKFPVTTMFAANNPSVNTIQPSLQPVTSVVTGATGTAAVTEALLTNGVTVSSGTNPTFPAATTAVTNNGLTTGFPAAPTFVTSNGTLTSIAPPNVTGQPTAAPGVTVTGSVISLLQNITIPAWMFGLAQPTTQQTPLPMTAAQISITTGLTAQPGMSEAVTEQIMPMMMGSSASPTTAPVLPWNIFPVPSQAPTVEILTNQPTGAVPQVTFAPIVIGNSSQQVVPTQKPLDILITTGVGLPFAPNVPAVPSPVMNNSAGDPSFTISPSLPSMFPAMAMGPVPTLPSGLVDSPLPIETFLPTTVNPLNSLTMFPGQGTMRNAQNAIPLVENIAAESTGGSQDSGMQTLIHETETRTTENNNNPQPQTK